MESMPMNTLYQDRLIRITDEEIVFNSYYFPTAAPKHLPWNLIESVSVRPGGSWRIWGTGDLRTWFPQDSGRPGRDHVFIIHLRNKYVRIGFTAENSQPVLEIFKQRNLIEE